MMCFFLFRTYNAQVIEATTVTAACPFKPSLPRRKREGEEEDEEEEDEEGGVDRRAVEEFMGINISAHL